LYPRKQKLRAGTHSFSFSKISYIRKYAVIKVVGG